MSRITRILSLALPVMLVCVLAFAGGWRVHDGRVERVSQDATSAAAPIVESPPSAAPADQMTFVHHLSPSIPWPVWAALILLCLLPAVASMLTWSGSHRGRESGFSTTGSSV
jgi:hypothetical protein